MVGFDLWSKGLLIPFFDELDVGSLQVLFFFGGDMTDFFRDFGGVDEQ